ncbi:MAG TPA: hypothetical protein DIV86_07790 [Alphaproteobacteria bacterium]|nr:hypothetical protein [Alphaproteobacteria bacterium]
MIERQHRWGKGLDAGGWRWNNSNHKPLNTYDLLKAIAIVTMIIDHVGMFFLPQVEAFRAIGRMSMPLFLFLVGYSQKYVVTYELLLWGAIITIYKHFIGLASFEANILVTIFLVRVMFGFLQGRELLQNSRDAIMVFCLIISVPSMLLFEYGSLAFMFAILGYCVKQGLKNNQFYVMVILVILFNYLLQSYISDSNDLSYYLVFSLVSIICAYLLLTFRLEDLNIKSQSVSLIIKWLSTNALTIYIIHFIAFSALSRLFLGEY